MTSFSKLRIGDDRTYLLREMDRDSKCLIGLLKVGYRKLFLHDVRGIQHEMCPLAVLDFYIHESKQRNGNGRKLFDYMIQVSKLVPLKTNFKVLNNVGLSTLVAFCIAE